MLMAMMFVVMTVWMLPHLNPPEDEASAPPPGNVIVHITWPEGNTDIDLWVMGPGEYLPIGYSNKGGLVWNLLRDDLGSYPDSTPMNYENAYSRGIAPGEYIVNVHCYRCPVLPQTVYVEVSISSATDGKGGLRVIATTQVELVSHGHELTAIRFRLDSNGSLVTGSLNNVYEPLRSMKAPTP